MTKTTPHTKRTTTEASALRNESHADLRIQALAGNGTNLPNEDVIFGGLNFGPMSAKTKKQIEAHQATRELVERAYQGGDDHLTKEQQVERENADTQAMMAALNLLTDKGRSKADDVGIMLYVDECGGDLEALQSLRYSDIRIFRNAYVKHLAQPKAADLDAQIADVIQHLADLVKLKDPTITDWRVDDRTLENGLPALRVTAQRAQCEFSGDGWYEIQDSWTVTPTVWYISGTDLTTPEAARLFHFAPPADAPRHDREHWVEEWLMTSRIYRKMPDSFSPPVRVESAIGRAA